MIAHRLLCLSFVAALANADDSQAVPAEAHGRTAVGTFDWDPSTGTVNIQGHNNDFANHMLQAAKDTDRSIDGPHDNKPMAGHRFWWQDAARSPFDQGVESDDSTSSVTSTSTELPPPVISAQNPFFENSLPSTRTSGLFSLINPGTAGQAGSGGAGSGNVQGGGIGGGSTGGLIGSGVIANAILNGQGVAASQSIGNNGGGVAPTARPPVIVGTGQIICTRPQVGGGQGGIGGIGVAQGGSQSGIGSQIGTQGGGGQQGGNLGTGGGNQGIHLGGGGGGGGQGIHLGGGGGGQGIHLGGGGGNQGIHWGIGGGGQGIHLGGGGINQGGLVGAGGGNQGIHLGGGGGGQGGLVGAGGSNQGINLGGGGGSQGGLLGGGGGNHPLLAGYAGLAALGNHFVAGSGAANFISAIHSAHRPFRPSGGGGVVSQAGSAAAAGVVSQTGSSNLQTQTGSVGNVQQSSTGTGSSSSSSSSSSASASASASSSASASATGGSAPLTPSLIGPSYFTQEETETRYVETQNAGEGHEEEDKDLTRRSSCSEGKICVLKNLCIDGLYVPLESDRAAAAIDSSDHEENICNRDGHVCCTLGHHDHDDGSHAYSYQRPESDALFGERKSNEYLPPGNEYLPSYEPDANNPRGSVVPPPQDEYTDGSAINPEALLPKKPVEEFVPQPQLGCAAALKCVEEQFCDLTGIIVKSPVRFTEEQLLRRVPMVSCRNPENGVVGKCCRDPDYVDPWPAGGNLPPNYKGGFDDNGFPLIYKMNYTTPRPVVVPVTGAAVDSQAITRPARRPTTPRPQPTLVIENVAPVQPEQPAPVAPLRPAQPVFVPQPPVRKPEPVRPILPVVEPIKPVVVQPVQPIKPVLSNNVFLNGQVQMPAPVLPEANNPPKTFDLPSFPSINNIQNAIGNQFESLFKPPQDVVQDTPAQPERPIIVAPVAPVTTTKRPNFVSNFVSNFVKPEQPMRIQAPIIESHVPGAQCGLVNKVQSQYALHDVEVPFGMIPWQAMILSNSQKKLLCSGAIIAPNVVITSAHCVYGREASDVSAKSGEWKLGYELKHEEPLPFEVINVQKIVTHPNYRHGSSSNDMAMLVLEKDFHLDQHVDTICLPQKPLAFEPAQRRCISTGWGKTIMQIHVAGALMNKLDVELLNPYECQRRLEGAESPLEIDDSLVCVKAQRQSNNMCQVDVGGPLACDRGDGFYELVGVYSQDTGCLPTNQVATFAVVDYQWINSVMNGAPAPRPVEYQGPAPFLPSQPLQPAPLQPAPVQPAPQRPIHYHEPGVPCDCRKGTVPAGLNYYLPPQ